MDISSSDLRRNAPFVMPDGTVLQLAQLGRAGQTLGELGFESSRFKDWISTGQRVSPTTETPLLWAPKHTHHNGNTDLKFGQGVVHYHPRHTRFKAPQTIARYMNKFNEWFDPEGKPVGSDLANGGARAPTPDEIIELGQYFKDEIGGFQEEEWYWTALRFSYTYGCVLDFKTGETGSIDKSNGNPVREVMTLKRLQK